MNTDLKSGSHHLHSICHHKSVFTMLSTVPHFFKLATRTPLNKIGTKWVRDLQDKIVVIASSSSINHATWKLRLRWILLEWSAEIASFTGTNGTDTRQVDNNAIQSGGRRRRWTWASSYLWLNHLRVSFTWNSPLPRLYVELSWLPTFGWIIINYSILGRINSFLLPPWEPF